VERGKEGRFTAVHAFSGKDIRVFSATGLRLLSRPVARSARDVWAVAYVEGSEERPSLQTVFHHDGRTWKKRNPPRRLLKIDPRECIANWPADSGDDPTEGCPSEGRPLEVAALPGDGSGGFWTIATRRDGEFILHRTRSDRLLEYPLPRKSRRLTYTDISVSRSGTVVATGYTTDRNGDDTRHYVWKLTGHR
jgi:hypothetical protein